MRAHGAALVLLLPLLSLGLAGCVDCDAGPPVTARGIAGGASSGGSGGFLLEILVVDGPGGAPLPGAGVVAYYDDDAAQGWTGGRVVVGPGGVTVEGGGSSVVVDPGVTSATPEAKRTVRLVTDADGVARARLPTQRIVGAVAAKDGWTEEWVPALATGDDGAAGRMELPLFRERLAASFEGVWGPGAASSGRLTASDYEWHPQPAPFGETDEARRAYAARIVELVVTVNWTNAPTGYGDLGVGVGPDPGRAPTLFRDARDDLDPGAHSETAAFGLDELQRHDVLNARAIQVGPAVDAGFVAPFGLPYEVHVEARFDRALAERAAKCGGGGESDSDGTGVGVPGPGVAATVAAGGLVALALGRRLRAS